MDFLAQIVLSHIRRHELLRAGDRVGVAVSGGIDSVALLRLLLALRGELGIVPSVVHFNHKLRGAESNTDEQFVAGLAREHGLELLSDSDDVAEYASREGVSVEAAARELRYGFFRYLLGEGSGSDPQGLKPHSFSSADGAAASRALSNLDQPQTRVFSKLERPEMRALSRLDKIVTGHTLDDQAETVLLRLIRGTGVAGLSGIYPRITVENDDGEISGEIVRPLLATRRCELEQYLKEIGQPWREDSTNADHAFTRNRLRKLVVPLLEKEFNPAVAENLAELAEIARGEEEYWDNEVAGWIGTAVHWLEPDWAQPASQKTGLVQISQSGRQPSSFSNFSAGADLQSKIENAEWLVANASVSRPWFLTETTAVQRRVVKAIGEHAGIPLEFKHVEEILRFAAEEGHSGRELSLPLGWKLVRHADELLFVTPDLREEQLPRDYEHELSVPGTAVVPEIGAVVEAHRVPAESVAEYNPDQLLDTDSLPGPLRVRNWRAGDRFWPAHTKSPKKVKELLQERHVAQPERGLWPVVLSGDEIVWVRGFDTHAKYGAKAGHDAVLIAERTGATVEET
ncbi:MAG TPA: tRNA lysidine(34) synthetase TilS [Candidatus Sulfotelmatobacter sp.]|nr:tRNA lysidine(34) synthetase TilS [Candidatus Sulfotelmatobacter sp.]